MTMVLIQNKQADFAVEGNENIQKALRTLIKGKFFKVEFVKADGTLRTMNGRMGVHKYVKGTGKTPPADSVVMYLEALKTYRSFKLDHLISLKCGSLEILGEAA